MHYTGAYHSAWVEKGGVYEFYSQTSAFTLITTPNLQVSKGYKVGLVAALSDLKA